MSEVFWIKLADRKICIKAINDYVREYCKEYIIECKNDDKSDIFIDISKEDIEFERKRSEEIDLKNNRKIRRFSDEYLETLAVYRKIAEKMLEFDTILFHGSVIAMDGDAYLFTAKSGTGKSTHTKLWQELYGNRVVMVNDDKPLIQIKEDKVIVYGTPWDGKHRRSNNIQVPLKAICILDRGEDNWICRCSKRDVYSRIVSQVYIPGESGELMKKTLGLVDRLLDGVGVYRLRCNMELEAVRVASEGMVVDK